MNYILSSLFHDLYQKDLLPLLEEVFSLQRRSFKILITTPSREMTQYFADELGKFYKKTELSFPIFLSLDEIKKIKLAEGPCTLVTETPMETLWGFVKLDFPELHAVLPAPAKFIAITLCKIGLESYMDFFETPIVQKISTILKNFGLGTAVDAIVQFALIAGYKGDEKKANQYLEKLIRSSFQEKKTKIFPSPSKTTEELFGDILLQSSNPHTYLKAALSFYAVKMQGQTISGASRFLNISRSTLLEHLRIAEEMNVRKLFPNLSPYTSTHFHALNSQPIEYPK